VGLSCGLQWGARGHHCTELRRQQSERSELHILALCRREFEWYVVACTVLNR
jgi:hypothetical protein